jgi:NAD(P)-dependent dehydrogenase (short-subunit alcohol dehydrogenase family)
MEGATTAIYQSRLLMKGKTVVVTGGTLGIGKVAVEALARMGARRPFGLVACVRRAPCADFYYIDALTVRTCDVRDHVPLTR